MKKDDLSPAPLQQIRFALASYRKVPAKPGCYVLTNFDNEILYIGKTNDFNRRFQEHLKDATKTKPTTKGVAFWFYYLETPLLKIDMLERTWMNAYETTYGELPLLNKIHSHVV